MSQMNDNMVNPNAAAECSVEPTVCEDFQTNNANCDNVENLDATESNDNCTACEDVTSPVVKDNVASPDADCDALQPIIDDQEEQSVESEVQKEQPVAEVQEEQPVAEVQEEQPVAEVQEEQPVVEVQEEQPVVEVQEEQPVVEVQEEQPAVVVQEESVVEVQEQSVVEVQEQSVVEVQEQSVVEVQEQSVVEVQEQPVEVEVDVEVEVQEEQSTATETTATTTTSTSTTVTANTNTTKPSVVKSLTDYVLTDSDRQVLNHVVGYKNSWFNKEEDGSSMADSFNDMWLGKASFRVLCWAVLASVDELRENSEKDPSQMPILLAVLRSGYVEMARLGVQTTRHAVTDQNHNVYKTKENFKSYTDVTHEEYSIRLADASVWTLMKALCAQLQAGVNRCYHRGQSDRPLANYDVKTNTKSNDKNAKKGAKGDRDQRKSRDRDNTNNEIQYRYVENATWNNLCSNVLISFLDSMKDSYNRSFRLPPNFLQAYRDTTRLRKEINEQRRIETMKQKTEQLAQSRASRSQNPPTDVKPVKNVNNKPGSEASATTAQRPISVTIPVSAPSAASDKYNWTNKDTSSLNRRVQTVPNNYKPRVNANVNVNVNDTANSNAKEGFQTVVRRSFVRKNNKRNSKDANANANANANDDQTDNNQSSTDNSDNSNGNDKKQPSNARSSNSKSSNRNQSNGNQSNRNQSNGKQSNGKQSNGKPTNDKQPSVVEAKPVVETKPVEQSA
jgi:hypothetical protein